MRARPTRQVNNSPGHILWRAQLPIRTIPRQRLHAAQRLHQPVGHARREETRRDGVAQDVAWAQVDGHVLHEVDHGGFGGRVRGDGLGAAGADADSGDGGGGDDARGEGFGRVLLEEGCESVERVCVS